MEVPEKLMGDFKALEQYGHALKMKYKKNFKRHIKIDDSLLCLYIDVYIPSTGDWSRVDIEAARADNRARMAKKTKNSSKHLCSHDGSDSGEEEEEEDGD